MIPTEETGTAAAQTTQGSTSATKPTQGTTAPKARASITTNKRSSSTTATSPSRRSSTSPTSASSAARRRTDVPPDTVTGANINPNLSSIYGRVIADVESLQVRSISLAESSVELKVGETVEIAVGYEPDYATGKLCTAEVSTAAASVQSSNSKITVTGKNAGTCVLTVTSKNGHRAVCNVTVKPNEGITDDTKLKYEELCTPENVNRWVADITGACAGLGMSQDTSLKGADITFDTAELKGAEHSYNEVSAMYIDSAAQQLAALTGGSFGDYVFNCSAEPNGSDSYILIVINKAETQPGTNAETEEDTH